MAVAFFASAAPVLGLAVCVVVHVAVSRALPRLPRQHMALAGALGGFVAVAVVAMWFLGATALPRGERWALAVCWALTYTALLYCYIFGFYNLGESARRIRLLIELHDAGARGLTRAEILRRYGAATIVRTRLERLLTGGQVVERDGRYVVGAPVMLWGAKVLVLLKVAFFRTPSEPGLAARHSAPAPRRATR